MVKVRKIDSGSFGSLFYLNAFAITEQAFLISSSVINKGGEMRMQCGAKRNQSVITPFSIQWSMILLLVSNESNSRAIHSPKERTALIMGCFSRSRKTAAFLLT